VREEAERAHTHTHAHTHTQVYNSNYYREPIHQQGQGSLTYYSTGTNLLTWGLRSSKWALTYKPPWTLHLPEPCGSQRMDL